METRADELLADVDELLVSFEAGLLARLGAEDVSERAKVPFNVLMCREVLLRRFLELARAGLTSLREQRFAAAAVLLRSMIETGAAIWYLAQSLESAVESGSSSVIRERVVRMLHGSRTTPEAPVAINVLTFINVVEKAVPTARDSYDRLSEMAHPNWAGTLYLFGRPNRDARECLFGSHGHVAELTLRFAALTNGTSLLVKAALDTVTANNPRLVAICERELGAA